MAENTYFDILPNELKTTASIICTSNYLSSYI